MATVDIDVLTLPYLSLKAQVPLEPLRKLVREHPVLSKLGVRAGPGKSFNERECAEIVRVFRERQALRAGGRSEVNAHA